ncbi:uncharacterized protein LOC121318146 isoform X2 [Polyodon spathula]|uniref:uncharacterized protein LOC121318146 isoform X2 n=1 Tax=Polyodon spathula TaxID=7913 RepID=UPI001B7F25B5|nr:uncharacterized protein LOC121318146 isoform X2 [Polyodon spathula]
MTPIKISEVVEIQEKAQCFLQQAIANERSRWWKKVVGNYSDLFKLLDRRSLPVTFKPGPHYAQLNGCLSGCHSSSCLHTPLFTRRAYAYAKCGELKNALKDAEKAVVLDSFNPALEMQRDAYVFQDLVDFKSPKINEFYNRFLWCLNVPHTVIELDLLSGSSFNTSLPGRPNGTPSALVLNKTPKNSYNHSQQRDPFRCGTPACYRDDSRVERRSAYGSALRKYSADMKGNALLTEPYFWENTFFSFNCSLILYICFQSLMKLQ